MAESTPLRIQVSADSEVSALLQLPSDAEALYVMAHGAGAGMGHPFMAEVASGLAARRIATLRYQFPFMEAGGKRVDKPAVAHVTVRAAVAAAARLSNLPMFAGGKSFGGRMTSQAQALEPLQRVLGLIFLGFPLHAPDTPSTDRAAHLFDVHVPMLFIQGTRDKLATPALISDVVEGLVSTATLCTIEHADHGFEVLVRSGRTHAEVMTEMLDKVAEWTRGVAGVDC